MQAVRSVSHRWGAASTADLLLLASFFVSGCSALMYQLAWQRALYAHIGVDIDSITIIVSVFMLGIGIGGMIGGRLADAFPSRRLPLYTLIELSIGAYGFLSMGTLGLLLEFGSRAAGGPTAASSIAACFFFLLLPTVLMGMTLPVLTMAFDERTRNIGISVGTLYFTNTLGAAAGAALVPFVLFPVWTLSQVVNAAALGNLVVMACALLAARALRMSPGRA